MYCHRCVTCGSSASRAAYRPTRERTPQPNRAALAAQTVSAANLRAARLLLCAGAGIAAKLVASREASSRADGNLAHFVGARPAGTSPRYVTTAGHVRVHQRLGRVRHAIDSFKRDVAEHRFGAIVSRLHSMRADGVATISGSPAGIQAVAPAATVWRRTALALPGGAGRDRGTVRRHSVDAIRFLCTGCVVEGSSDVEIVPR